MDKAQVSPLPPLLVTVQEEKGGVGKSTMASVAFEATSLLGENVEVLDTDDTNSAQAMVRTARVVNLRADGYEGELLYVAERLKDWATRRKGAEKVEHVVVDTGARDDVLLRPFLPELARYLRSFGAYLIVIRPMTLSHFVQHNAHEFVHKTMTADMGVICVYNLGQGRNARDFDEWKASVAMREMRLRGVVECDLENAGTKWSDMATSCGLTLADAAMGRFTKAGDDAEVAASIFTRPVQLFLARWLERQTVTLRGKFVESIARR